MVREVNTELSKDKTVSVDEIKKSATYEEALKLYIEAQNQKNGGSQFQRAVAEVALRFGKAEEATQFTILAGQTENIESMGNIAQYQRSTATILDEAIGQFGKTANGLDNGAMEKFSSSARSLTNTVDRFEQVASQISRAASQMGR